MPEVSPWIFSNSVFKAQDLASDYLCFGDFLENFFQGQIQAKNGS